MFVTLKEFFDDYRIKNNQQPNETVLNLGLMRLKREIREMTSMLAFYANVGELPIWINTMNYEIDEYLTHDGHSYKSRTNNNNNNTPFPEDDTYWEKIVHVDGSYDNDTINGFLNLKSDTTYVDGLLSDINGGAAGTRDTLKKLSDILDTKSNADDVYTKAENDVLLGFKAGAPQGPIEDNDEAIAYGLEIGDMYYNAAGDIKIRLV